MTELAQLVDLAASLSITAHTEDAYLLAARKRDEARQGKAVKSFNMNELVIAPPVKPVEAAKNGTECVTLRTPKEAVEQFFTNFPQLQHLSNREIAKRCGATEGTVRNYKKELFPEPIPEPEPEIFILPDAVSLMERVQWPVGNI